jgi:hypothetical protein
MSTRPYTYLSRLNFMGLLFAGFITAFSILLGTPVWETGLVPALKALGGAYFFGCWIGLAIVGLDMILGRVDSALGGRRDD